MDGDDGPVLSQQRVALPAAGCLRAIASVQGPNGSAHLGRSAGEAARGRGRGGPPMNLEAVERLANAVLYEGYLLYPYRASAVKNQRRFNFGVLVPPAYSALQSGTESSRLRAECLV